MRNLPLCYLLNLRLACHYRAEQTAQVLESYIFAEQQLASIPEHAMVVVVTLSIMPNEEAVHALQLRTPFLPIGSMARYNAAYTENSVGVALNRRKTAPPARPADINYTNYTAEELADSDLLNRFMKRGAYLYDELRDKEPVTLAYLIAERKMREMQLQEQERERQVRSRQKKPRTPSAAGSAARQQQSASSSAVVDDDNEEDEGISLSSEEEAVATDTADDDDDDDNYVSATDAVAAADDRDDASVENDDRDDDDASSLTDLSASISSDNEDIGDSRVAEPVARHCAQKENGGNDDDDDNDDDNDDSVYAIASAAAANRLSGWRHAAPNDVPVTEKKPKNAFDDPAQPLKIDLKRADECEWLRLVIAKKAYRFLFDISCIVPNKTMLREHARAISVNIEAGVSRLPQAMNCDDDQTAMTFLVANSAQLKSAIAEYEAKRKAATATSAVAAASIEHQTAPLLSPPLQSQQHSPQQQQQQQLSTADKIVEPRVSVTSLLSPQYHDEIERDVLPIRDSEIDHPLNDYRRFVDASQLTLYEINCYASQRLAVLLLAYQAYHIETDDERRQPHIDALIRSQYPTHSGATYHLIHGFAGAKDRQLMHEGIGLAMLCFCAKHDVALCDNLLLLEMCYLKHKHDMKEQELANGRDDDDDGDDANNNGKNALLELAITKHLQTIMNYIEGCTDVLSLQNDPLVLQQQEVATYVEFFAILQDLINEWHAALAEIEENRRYEPNNNDEETH